jgi:carboxypeptidase C (cathepsin A)
MTFKLTGIAALLACLPLAAHAAPAAAPADKAEKSDKAEKAEKTADAAEASVPRHLKDEVSRTNGTLSIGGKAYGYGAEAGILVVHVKDPMDADPPPAADKPAPVEPEAGMSYVAYFLGAQPDPARPITFVFNGGPGSSTMWLHMGAFGPKRVVTIDGSHSPAAPYRVIDNNASLLPETDLVFIDAPGTGFGHLRGADKEKAFYGVDPDAHAFANFIVEFLSRHGRWNSPKYLFGESYGTLRAAVVANVLQNEKLLDLNGVMLLSQILIYTDSVDRVDANPGVDQAYALALPTYAATAWYHKRLPTQAPALEPFLREVEQFALGDYLTALAAGSTLSAERRAAIVARLHAYTGLDAEYLERADLRITGGVFEQHVLGDRTAGRLDTRFSGATIDPLGKAADYDPQSSAISSAYDSAFNDYVRRELKFGDGKTFKPNNYAGIGRSWDRLHAPPGASSKLAQAANVLPDLADAMKMNPELKVQMHGGYYDLATPYFAAEYELWHLPLPPEIARNIEVKLYPAGHMVYAHDASRLALHDNAADFIKRTHGAASH